MVNLSTPAFTASVDRVWRIVPSLETLAPSRRVNVNDVPLGGAAPFRVLMTLARPSTVQLALVENVYELVSPYFEASVTVPVSVLLTGELLNGPLVVYAYVLDPPAATSNVPPSVAT